MSPKTAKSEFKNRKKLLSEFYFELYHISGKENIFADQISRNFSISNKDTYSYPSKQIHDEQISSNILSENHKLLNVINIFFDEKDRMIIPDKLSDKLLVEIHNYLGHPGGRTMIGVLKDYLNINKLMNKCYIISKKCIKCQRKLIIRGRGRL